MSNIVFVNPNRCNRKDYDKLCKKIQKKIAELIEDIERNGNYGKGRPEPLTGNYAGYWSREIDKKNRLIYRISADGIICVAKFIGHYNDK